MCVVGYLSLVDSHRYIYNAMNKRKESVESFKKVLCTDDVNDAAMEAAILFAEV